MTAIHLNMMKLEGNGERSTEEATAITPPHKHGIAKQICVFKEAKKALQLYEELQRCKNIFVIES